MRRSLDDLLFGEADMEYRPGVYAIRCTINNKVYIGSSVTVKKRIQAHRRALVKSKHVNKHLQNSFHKFGISGFVCEALEYCDKSQTLEREQFYIDQNLGNLFNVTNIADVFFKFNSIEIVCEYCQVSYLVSKSVYDRGDKNRFCSRQCSRMGKYFPTVPPDYTDRRGFFQYILDMIAEMHSDFREKQRFNGTKPRKPASEELRKKASERFKGKPSWNKGLTKETAPQLSRKGKISDETRKLMSQAQRRRFGTL